MNNICFNERQSVWTTKYDWNPIVSANINGNFYSIGGLNAEDEPNINIWSHKVTESEPTVWFDEQHPFEFEFVISEPQGVHKIIENLQILSNNVQPEQITFEIIGDAYQFNKERIKHLARIGEDFSGERVESTLTHKDEFNRPLQSTSTIQDKSEGLKTLIKNFSKIKVFDHRDWTGTKNIFSEIKQDKRTKQFHYIIPQECRNIETFGRRLGNIHYKEDSWHLTVEPIRYDASLDDPKATEDTAPSGKDKSTKIRDKWCKVRVRYTGEDLAIITAIRTIMNV